MSESLDDETIVSGLLVELTNVINSIIVPVNAKLAHLTINDVWMGIKISKTARMHYDKQTKNVIMDMRPYAKEKIAVALSDPNMKDMLINYACIEMRKFVNTQLEVIKNLSDQCSIWDDYLKKRGF
jgi:hypothetical protein